MNFIASGELYTAGRAFTSGSGEFIVGNNREMVPLSSAIFPHYASGCGKNQDRRHVPNPFKETDRVETATMWQKATSTVVHSSVTFARNKRPRESWLVAFLWDDLHWESRSLTKPPSPLCFHVSFPCC